MLAALAVACDFVTPPGKTSVSALAVVAGDSQAGRVGAVLPTPIQVRALDAQGQPLPGQTISFAVTSGGGSVDSASVTTDDSGIAVTRWTLGTSATDQQALEASTGGSNPATVTIVAVAQAAGPATLQKIAGDNQTAAPGDAVPDSLAVKLVDQYGNPVPAASVTWTTSSGSIAPHTGQTNAAGIARAAWVLGTQAGSFSATASHDGVTPVTFSAGTSLNGTTLTKTAGDGQSAPVDAPLPQALVVTLRSPGGAPIQGASVRWTPGPDGGTVQPGSSTTDGNGNAEATWTMPGSTGQKTLTADVAGQASATFTATATAGAAATIRIVAGNEQSGVVGSMLANSLAVQLKDAAGNPVSGASVAWAVTGGGNGATMTPAQAVTNADGVASTFWSLGLRADTTHVATATANGLAPVTFTATPLLPPALTLVRTAGDSQVGQVSSALAESLVVTAKLPAPDGRAVQGVRMTWSASGGGTIGAGTDRTLADGSVHAKWTLGPNAGTQTATARWLNAQNQPVDSTVFTATAGLAPPTASPTLSVSAPLNWSVARPGIRITLGCAFGGRVCNVTARIGDSVIAQGANQLDQTLSLAAYDGGNVVLALCAEDPTGTVKASCTGRSIVVESSTHLAEAYSVPGGVLLDANKNTAAFVSDTATALGGTFCSSRLCSPGDSPALTLIDRSSGASADVAGGRYAWSRVLTGSALLYRGSAGTTVYWRSGAGTDLGSITPDVAGAFAAWLAPGTTNALRLDGGSGSVTTVSSAAGPGVSAAANGDVWYAANQTDAGAPLGTFQVFRWSSGTGTQITADTAHDNLAPATDGSNAAFLQRDLSGGGQRLELFSGSFTQVADSTTATYDMSNGWVFFYRQGSGQLWSRAPGGATAQVTVFGTTSTPEAYGNNGEVVFTNSGRRYEAVPGYTAPPTDVMGSHGQRVVNINGNLYVALGRTLFQIR